MTDIPQWAVERGREIVAAVLEGSAGAYSIKQTPEETAAELVAFVARALTEAAPGWTMTADGLPDFGQPVLAVDEGRKPFIGKIDLCMVVSAWTDGRLQRTGVWCWMPLPAAPEVG